MRTQRPPARPELDDLHIRLFVARQVELHATNWNIANVQDSFWRLYLNDRAGAGLQLADGLYPLEPNRLYVVPAGVRFDCTNSATIRHFYIHFDLLGLPRTALHTLFSGPCCVPACAGLAHDARLLAQELAEQPPLRLMQQCSSKALLYRALAAYLASVAPETIERYERLAAAYAPVRAALRTIDESLPEQLTNGRLAHMCHMSEDYFIRRFGECMGQSPAHYIQEQRVMRAAQLLAFSADSIEDVAAATGFPNRFYFSRVFTRRMGIAPAAYRRAARV